MGAVTYVFRTVLITYYATFHKIAQRERFSFSFHNKAFFFVFFLCSSSTQHKLRYIEQVDHLTLCSIHFHPQRPNKSNIASVLLKFKQETSVPSVQYSPRYSAPGRKRKRCQRNKINSYTTYGTLHFAIVVENH